MSVPLPSFPTEISFTRGQACQVTTMVERSSNSVNVQANGFEG